jgi:hypothetical protein
VVIEGTGAPGLTSASIRFTCTAPTAAGQFTIPAEVLISLAADASDQGNLVLSAYSPITTVFRAPGLDFGQFSFTSPIQ